MFILHFGFCLDACEELQRVHDDIPSILYGTLSPPEYPLYNTLKEQREVAKANYEAGLIDLDGYLGKVGALSLTTGRSKAVADDDDVEDNHVAPKRKANEANDDNPPKKKKTVGAAIPGRRGRPAKNTGKDARTVSSIASNEVSVVEPLEETPAAVPSPEASRPANLPWPTLEGLQPLPSALPATSSRTTTSAVPRVIVAGQHQAPIVLSSILVFNNSLQDHIQKYNLGLRERALIPGDGNCWFASIADLAKLHKLNVPEDPNVLRIAIANSLKTHPQKSQWVRSIFNGKARSFNRFVKENSIPGTFVDNFGLLVIATSDYLDAVIHIVGTSNNEKDPVTVIGKKEGRNVVFHCGYYQDTTDAGGHGARAGHYQSLEPIPGHEIPCCQIKATPENTTREVDDTIENNIVEMLQNEEKILSSFPGDKSLVKQSLTRLKNLNCVSLDDLCCTNILHILYNDVRQHHGPTSQEGKLCRRLLKKFQNMCMKDPEFDNEDLPTFTDISDDEEVDVQKKKKSFRSLFTKELRRQSTVIAEMRESSSIEELDNGSARASSTVIEHLQPAEPNIESIEEFEPAMRKSVQKQKRRPKPKSSMFDSNTLILTPPLPSSPERSSVILTPPPPCSPATPPRRGRGRPRKRLLDDTSPAEDAPVKRGRGRPRKN